MTSWLAQKNGLLFVACAASLGVATFSACRSFVPVRAPYATRAGRNAGGRGAADQLWMRRVAFLSGGDYKKLTPADRARLNRLTRGYGREALARANTAP